MGVSFLNLAPFMHLFEDMKLGSRQLSLLVSMVLWAVSGLSNEVSPEERIREFQKPRGLSQSPSSKSSPGSNASSPTPAKDPYAEMGKVFSDQMAANTKANDEIQKLIPKAEAEPDYLKSLAGAATVGGSNSNISATLNQITEATIASIKTLTEMQIAVEKAKAETELAALRKKQNWIREQELQEKTAGLSPIAIALGALNKPAFSTPSPVSVRTKISAEPGHSKGLFPSSLNDISARAYNAPR